jgi:GTPase
MNKQHNAFVDHALVKVAGGRGGNGASHFRREKYVPLGGPDGGDGGHGGTVWFVADDSLKTLVDFSYRREYQADMGSPGTGQRKSGRQGEDLTVRVPVGTLVLNPKGELLADLKAKGERFAAAKGGRGGRGNIHFATSTRQAPTLAEKGEPGEERELVLELKLLADVGVVGLPNAGKSTLLAAVSAARPKIANYPFTTLTPNLGRVRLEEGESFVLVDIPGLIAGAADGAGLGHEFLRHVERNRLLIHLIDVGSPEADPKEAYKTINLELRLYDPKLLQRPQIVALNKVDLIEDPKTLEPLVKWFKKAGHDVFLISAATRQGVWELARAAHARLRTLPVPEFKALPPAKPAADAPRFTLTDLGAGHWRVTGREVEKWVAMTDFTNQEAVDKLRNIFDRIGLTEEFKRRGLKNGQSVAVGKEEFLYQEDDELL